MLEEFSFLTSIQQKSKKRVESWLFQKGDLASWIGQSVSQMGDPVAWKDDLRGIDKQKIGPYVLAEKKQDLFWISDHFKVEIPNSKYIVCLIIWPRVHEQQKNLSP